MTEATATVTVQDALRATNQHYELPPELFAQFLDARLKYSSGIYLRPDTTLDEAQTNKLHFIADLVKARPGGRLLDIGCGWGSLTLFMAKEYGCQVTGVTPSGPQARYIGERAAALGIADLVDIVVGPFSDVHVGGRFDSVTMVGSINHMPNQDEVVAKVHDLMRKDALLYISESCFRSKAIHEGFARRPGTLQVTEDIFGFADMVPLSDLVGVAENAGFSVVGVRDLTWHFERTVRDWIELAKRRRDAIEQIAPGMHEPLMRYLETTNAAWGYTTKQYALVALRNRLGPEEL
jgi:cyclopropane-fatty-acyl-phospholipid synthase